MALPSSFISDLKLRNPIVDVISGYVPVKRMGRNLKCKCPFHNETDASLVIYADTQSFYCFGCGAAGDVISFVRKIENLDYISAVEKLADRVGMLVPAQDVKEERYIEERKKIIEINRESAKFYYNQLISNEGRIAQEYLKKRKISHEFIKKFGLGYASSKWDMLTHYLIKEKHFTEKELLLAAVSAKGKNGKLYDLFRNRLIIPIINIRGEVIAFGGRSLEDSGPKYLNSADTPAFKKSRNLFAMNIAKSSKTEYFLLAEGYLDVISLHQAGFISAVASLGTALTREQAYLLSTYKSQLILTYDSDDAGIKATKRAIELLDGLPLQVRVLQMQGAKDPDEYIQKFGAERYSKLIEQSLGAMEWLLEKAKEGLQLNHPDDQLIYLKRTAEELSKRSDIGEKSIYAGKIAEELSIDKETVLLQIERFSKNQNTTVFTETQKSKNQVKKVKISKAVRQAEMRLLSSLYYHPDYQNRLTIKLKEEFFPEIWAKEIYNTLHLFYNQQRIFSLEELSKNLSETAYGNFIYCINEMKENQSTIEEVEKYCEVLESDYFRKEKNDIREMEENEFTRYMKQLSEKKQRGI